MNILLTFVTGEFIMGSIASILCIQVINMPEWMMRRNSHSAIFNAIQICQGKNAQTNPQLGNTDAITVQRLENKLEKQCPKCGQIYPEDDIFCKSDASRLVDVGVPAKVELSQPQPPIVISPPSGFGAGKGKGKPPVLGISIAVAALIILGLVAIQSMRTMGSNAEYGKLIAARQDRSTSEGSGSSKPVAPTETASDTTSAEPKSAEPPVNNEKKSAEIASSGSNSPPAKIDPMAASPVDQKAENPDYSVYHSALLGVSLEYPRGWKVSASKTSDGQRITFTQPNQLALLILDAGPTGDKLSAMENWTKLDRGFKKKYGLSYENSSVSAVDFGGTQGSVWEFTLQRKQKENKTHSVDWCAQIGNMRYALLCRAPATDYEGHRAMFDRVAGSFKLINPVK